MSMVIPLILKCTPYRIKTRTDINFIKIEIASTFIETDRCKLKAVMLADVKCNNTKIEKNINNHYCTFCILQLDAM